MVDEHTQATIRSGRELGHRGCEVVDAAEVLDRHALDPQVVAPHLLHQLGIVSALDPDPGGERHLGSLTGDGQILLAGARAAAGYVQKVSNLTGDSLWARSYGSYGSGFNAIASTPDGGSIALFGRDITRVPCRRRTHLGMARTYQIITLFPNDTILHNVTLAFLGLSPLRWNPFTALMGRPDLAERAYAALARVGLDHIAERPLAQTSYGERRRVEIAMALAQEPRCSCSTSRSRAFPSTSGATCRSCSRPSRAT